MPENLYFFLLAAPVVLLTGISKGGFAGGLGVLAVPLLSLLIDPIKAAVIMLPILCVMDIYSILNYRRHWDKRNLCILLPAALVGIGFGALSFGFLDANTIRLLVGILALYFVGQFALTKLSQKKTRNTKPSKLWGYFWGCLSGFCSCIAHAGGPPLSVYLLPQRLDKSLMVGTSIIFFTVVNFTKLVPYAWLGQLNLTNLKTSLVLFPLALLGVRLGVYLHRKISDAIFYLICYGLLMVAGLKLSIEAIIHLLNT